MIMIKILSLRPYNLYQNCCIHFILITVILFIFIIILFTIFLLLDPSLSVCRQPLSMYWISADTGGLQNIYFGDQTLDSSHFCIYKLISAFHHWNYSDPLENRMFFVCIRCHRSNSVNELYDLMQLHFILPSFQRSEVHTWPAR